MLDTRGVSSVGVQNQLISTTNMVSIQVPKPGLRTLVSWIAPQSFEFARNTNYQLLVNGKCASNETICINSFKKFKDNKKLHTWITITVTATHLHISIFSFINAQNLFSSPVESYGRSWEAMMRQQISNSNAWWHTILYQIKTCYCQILYITNIPLPNVCRTPKHPLKLLLIK